MCTQCNVPAYVTGELLNSYYLPVSFSKHQADGKANIRLHMQNTNLLSQ